MDSKIAELAKMLTNAFHAVVLTGAGMDTESNIPDFRSKTGWWSQVDPKKVASVDTLEENYDLFYEFNRINLELLEKYQPHQGHYVLAKLEEQGLIAAVATQNITGFHQAAGSKKVYELHGNLRNFYCHHCGTPATREEFLQKKSCRHCGQKVLRPNVVLFGESLPPEAWRNAVNSIEKSDLLIVIGTSLEVYPVNQLPLLAKGKTVYINMEEGRRASYDFDMFIRGKAGEVLQELMNAIQNKI
ncbi:MAG TPA: NAD-dependent deacylase [Clostridia bacterium]|nr:NAD-dependent deacylase [Clostridia bacterium]